MSEKTQQTEKEEALSTWRKHYWFDIMEQTRKKMQTILKSKTSTNREKIDAAKTLARMVSGLQPEKVIQKPRTRTPKTQETGVLTDKELKDIEELAQGDW